MNVLHGWVAWCRVLAALGLLVSARWFALVGPRQQPRAFVVRDDVGFDDVDSARGHQTPNIDSLAREGIVLIVLRQDVCSPSRATFMTGDTYITE